MNGLLRICVLLIAATGAAAFTNAVRPGRIDWVIDPAKSNNPNENKELAKKVEITFDELLMHLQSGSATIVDARKPDEFTAGHLAGAINIPSTEKEQHIEKVFTMVKPAPLVIIYCGGGQCEASHEVFEFFVGSGIEREKLRLFSPGWEFLHGRTDVTIVQGME